MAIATYNDVASGTKTTGVTSSSGKSKSSAYTNAVASPQTYKKVYSDVGIIKNDQPKNNGGGTIVQTGSSSGGSSGGGGGGSSTPEVNYENELLEKIKSLLSNERQSMYDAAKAAYEQSLLKNSTDSESLSNDANVKRERNDRLIRSLYGPGMGQGISNRIANHNRWADTLASIKSNRANNDLIALNTYNQNKANADNMYTQGLYSYVMPVYTNRQNYSDSLQNQLRLYQMQLENSKL